MVTLKEREEKQIVIKAISDLGHRVTAADIASRTGLPMASSTSMLNLIAQETGGHLEVSDKGDIAYRFKNAFQTVYLTTGIRAFFNKVCEKIFAIFFYLLKISFGIFLTLSLVIVVIGFIALAILGSQGSDRDDFSVGELFEFFSILIFRDLLLWGTISDLRLPRHQKPARKTKENFFLNCFSFLFGDGNPNAHLDEERWRLTAKVIRENGGVVVKEQLAPYIGPELEDDDDSILPVLTRFEGQPVVTAKGRIAYIFPTMQVTGDVQHNAIGGSEESDYGHSGYLREKLWQFSNLSKDALKRVYIVAGLNLFGTFWLYYIFNHLFHLRMAWTLVLLAYGAMFVLIPLCRNLWQEALNHRIKIRNYEREEAAKLVSNPDREMRAKLSERQEFAPSLEIRGVEADSLAYSTAEENLEQVFKRSEEQTEGGE